MELLIELDSIQGGDPMIRDGKRSISRDLVKFLDFIDGIAVKRQEVSYRVVKNATSFRKGDDSNARVLRSKCGDSSGNRRGLGGNGNGKGNERDLGGKRRQVIENLRDRVQKINEFSRAFDNDEESVELEGFHQVICDDEDQNTFDSGNDKGGSRNVRNGIVAKKHGGQGQVKKSVSFAKNGNVYKIFASTNSDSSEELLEEEKLSNEDDSKVSEAEEEEEELHSEDGGSSQSSDAGRSPTGRLGRFEVSRDSQGQNGNMVFAAPVTLKMESRDDSAKKRKALKIVS
ncbi:hypothetical protein ACFE04_007712 [Oxalis oulophora]